MKTAALPLPARKAQMRKYGITGITLVVGRAHRDVHDELPPCVGEKLRDALSERAIATLADNEDDA